MHTPSVGNPRKGSQTPTTAPKPLDTDKHAPLPFKQTPRQRFGDSLLARLYMCLSVCLCVCVHGLHGNVAKRPGHFEIQKNSSVMPTKNAYLKIFIFRNTRNMSEVANRWVLKYEKNSGGALRCGECWEKSVRPKMTF